MRNCVIEIEELKGKLSSSKQLEEESLSNANKWMVEARETQEKYEREIVQHARLDYHVSHMTFHNFSLPGILRLLAN